MDDALRVTRAARRLAGVLRDRVEGPVQAACGLTPKELMLLRAFEGGSAHPHQLADRTDTPAPLVTRALDRLSELGYVERRPDTVDRRRVVVVVSEAGASASAQGWQALSEVVEHAFRNVPEGAFDRLAAEMEALFEAVEASPVDAVSRDAAASPDAGASDGVAS